MISFIISICLFLDLITNKGKYMLMLFAIVIGLLTLCIGFPCSIIMGMFGRHKKEWPTIRIHNGG